MAKIIKEFAIANNDPESEKIN